MKVVMNQLMHWLGKPYLVEFDYRVGGEVARGRCYVRQLFGSEARVKQMFASYGYRNINIF